MSLGHAQALDLFSAYLERELDAQARQDLEQHLSGCASCRHELVALEKTVQLVSRVPKAMAPPDFLRRVQHRIRQRSRGRYYGFRAATRIPFEVVSFALIIMVLALYVLLLLTGPVAPK